MKSPTNIVLYIFEIITRSENSLKKDVRLTLGGRYITIIFKIISLEDFRLIDISINYRL